MLPPLGESGKPRPGLERRRAQAPAVTHGCLRSALAPFRASLSPTQGPGSPLDGAGAPGSAAECPARGRLRGSRRRWADGGPGQRKDLRRRGDPEARKDPYNADTPLPRRGSRCPRGAEPRAGLAGREAGARLPLPAPPPPLRGSRWAGLARASGELGIERRLHTRPWRWWRFREPPRATCQPRFL